MKIVRLLWIFVFGTALVSANASDEALANFQFAGGNGRSLETAVKVLGNIDESQFATAKLKWLKNQYPKSKTVDILFPCVGGKRFHVHKIQDKSGLLTTIYFDSGNVRNEFIVNGKVRTDQDFANQIIAEVEKSNISPEQKQRMLSSLRREEKPKKPGECA